MLDHQEKYMMKAQVHMSKSSAISNVQPLPQRKHYYQTYQVVKHILRGRLLASFQEHEHEGGDTISQGGIKDNDSKIKIQDHSMHMISQRNSQDHNAPSFKKGHVGFYRRFIKDFSKISRPMTKFLEQDSDFDFNKKCIKAFETLKEKLMNAPIMVSPDWSQPFELMCDASDFAVGAVLGQREGKHFRPIHFASKTLNNTQQNYTVTEKELLVVVFTFDKF
nr:reverse transcriptase domain-containing protein [Tanacetum cinerariifolium]